MFPAHSADDEAIFQKQKSKCRASDVWTLALYAAPVKFHHLARRKLHDKLKSILSKIRFSFCIEEGSSNRPEGQIKLYGKTYSVVRWDETKYANALKNATALYPKNGPVYVETCFSNALLDVLIGSSPLEKAVATMHATLTTSVRRRFVCIPIHGIDLRAREVAFGFGKLMDRKEGDLPQLINDIESLSFFQHRINALNECLCYFEFEVETDHTHSIDSAIPYANYLTSLLSLYVGSSQYRTYHLPSQWHKEERKAQVGRKRKIAIYGSEAGSSKIYYEYYANDSNFKKSEYSLECKLLTGGHDADESFNESLDFLRPERAKTTYHLVDDVVIAKMLSQDFESLLTCTTQTSPQDKKLFNAVSWFGKAVNCDSSEDQFLFFAIAIECLLIGDQSSNELASQGSITQVISERSAYLNADTFEDRCSTEKETKKLYKIRSKIVHSGAKVRNDEVIRIEQLARKLIFAFAKKKFQSEDEYLEWIKTCQYGAQSKSIGSQTN